MLEASSFFPGFRLPELFCGFPRKESIFPVEYPTSCSPQAWASGAISLILTIILGISIDPKENQILIKPILPDEFRELVINGIKIAQSQFDLKLTLREGKTEVKILKAPEGFEVNF
jgi:glycogen debranching enzyme